MRYFKKLVGDRIYLSPINSEDTELFVKWLNDFEITDYLGRSGNTVTINDEKEYLENKRSSGNSVQLAIVTLEEDKLLGTVSLENIDTLNRCAMLGIFIGEKEYFSNGYGTEAIRLILDYGFNYLNLNNISLHVMDFNPRAIKCYEKCGFKEYGRRRKCKFINGKYYDSICMDILAEEFNEDFIRNKNQK